MYNLVLSIICVIIYQIMVYFFSVRNCISYSEQVDLFNCFFPMFALRMAIYLSFVKNILNLFIDMHDKYFP